MMQRQLNEWLLTQENDENNSIKSKCNDHLEGMIHSLGKNVVKLLVEESAAGT